MIPVGPRRSWAARTGRAPGSPGCAAPPSGSRSARCRPAARRRRPSCPTSPRSGWTQARRRVRQRRDRGRRRARGRQQRQRRRHVRAAAGARPAGDRDRRRPAGRDADVRHRPGPDADGRPGRPGLDPAGQPADRQRAAAGDQPAAGAAVGQAAADPAPPALRRHPVLRLARRLRRRTRTRSTSRCCWSSAWSASPSAGSASRSCR